MSDTPTFTVTLHHLAPGAKQVNAALPDTELPAITGKKLHELIRALAALVSTNLGTASPELRIVAPQGQFVVKISEGRLRINSWTIKVGGADLSPDQIFSLITGAEAVTETAEVAVSSGGTKSSRGTMIAVLVFLVLGINAVTAWMLLGPQPPPPLLPEFTPLAKEPADRFIAEIAGDYQTGSNEGARNLKVAKDGHVHWLRLGPGGAVAEETELAVKPVQSRGKPGLLADDRALIEADVTGSLVFYNQIYKRKVH